ncbi:putative F-box/FBD/LRR-repeat protein At5g56810 isoform X2 [Nicotiana tabacum]|uniref:F-box/FBD/LRR-repeat protein At5g56810 isoform X2 n=1 Tax=Nicotiana tabacum TaxID=4097 RepID=A0AC58RQN5_TOBAC
MWIIANDIISIQTMEGMEGTDQISELPVSILEHIQSLLVVKDALNTSTLSKAWNSAWASLSCLNFGDDIFSKSKNIVSRILADRQKQNISVRKFMVKLPYASLTSNYVDNWINILVACNIKELSIEVERTHTYIKLPEAIFAAKALNMLRLGGFKLELPSDGVKFSSLRELYLAESFLDEQLLQALCASCSNLEVLSLSGFHGPISLQVAGTLPKLRAVYLEDCPDQFQMVDIAAPNLKDLEISSFCEDLHVIKITACKSLKHLELLTVEAVTDQWLEELLPNIPNLEIFHLSCCSLWKTVNISSDRLKYFQVTACNNLIEVDLDTPNLLGFLSDVRYGEDTVDPLPTFNLKASNLLEACLCLIPETLDNPWYSKLIKSLGNFNHCNAITLCCENDKEIVIPKDMRENLLPPLYDAKCLRVTIMNPLNHSVVDVVDSLLWISPQLDSLYFGCGTEDLKTLKFTSRDAADDEDEKPCCASMPWKCWRHELKKVKLNNFTCTELQELRNYLLTNTDILEEIIEVPP